jgi:carbamoyl-phosphate synthase small subunit
MTLDDYLKRWEIPGVQGIDTRALTRHLRTRGAMKACLTTERISEQEAIDRAVTGEGVIGMDYVREVTPAAPYEWDPDDQLSAEWAVASGTAGEVVRHDLPPKRHKIVAYDYGMKENILRRLRQQGFGVTVVPATTSADEVLLLNPDGVFLSNGPGDPAALDYAHQSVRGLMGKKPIFGICLGHQVLGYAFGGKTFKLKFGHRGANHPVQDVETGQAFITTQNHGYAVDEKTLPFDLAISHRNLNDGTVEGLRHRTLPIRSVQFHPEGAPGPKDAGVLLDEWLEMTA